MIKCLIFDCDGTLVDSEYLCNLGLEIKLKDYGIESSANTMMKKYRGGKLAEILQSIEKEHNINLKESFVSEYREIVDELFEKESPSKVGAAIIDLVLFFELNKVFVILWLYFAEKSIITHFDTGLLPQLI